MTASGRALARAGLVVTGAYLASRLLGWVRTAVFASVFGGSSPQLDAYYAAFRIPDTIFQLVAAGALSSALIPVLAALFARDEDDEAWRVVSNVLQLMLGALLVLAVVMFALAPVVMPAITPGYHGEKLDLTVSMTRTMLLSPILLALGAVATSALNARSRFTAAAVAPLLYNASIIVAAAFFVPAYGVEALAYGVVVGSALLLAAQLPSLLRAGFRLLPGIDLRDRATRQVLVLVAPRALGLGATQITFFVNTALASALGDGPVSVYNYAFTILQIPIGVIGIPLGIVLLPELSRAWSGGAGEAFGSLVVRSVRMLLYVMLFLTTIAMALRIQVVVLLLGYGRFEAVTATSDALLVFMVGMAGDSLVVVLARAFYAGNDTRVPVTAALVAVAINVAVSVLTIGPIGVPGLALGIAVGAWVEAAILLVVLSRRTLGLDVGAIVRAGCLFLVGAVIAEAVATVVIGATQPALGIGHGKPAVFVQAVLATLAAGGTYAAFGWLIRIPELFDAVRLFRSALPGARA